MAVDTSAGIPGRITEVWQPQGLLASVRPYQLLKTKQALHSNCSHLFRVPDDEPVALTLTEQTSSLP